MKKTTVKFLSLLMAMLFVLFSMTACLATDLSSDDDEEDKEEEKTPEELYVEALNAVNASTNWEMTTTQVMDLTAKVNGQTETQQQTQSILQRMCGGDGYVKVWGPSLNTETWYVDGTLYVVNGSVKAKATLSLDKYREKYQSDTDANLLNIPSDWFDEVKLEENDGKISLHFHVSGDQYAAAVGDLMDSLGGVSDVKLSEVDYIVDFDENGNIVRITNDFSATFTVEGQTVTADYHTVSDVKLNTVKGIEAPQGGDSFTDVTSQI